MRSRLGELDGAWLEARCGQCGRITVTPTQLLARRLDPGRPLGAIVAKLACQRCKARPAEVYLNETASREAHGGGPPGWSVRLVPQTRL